MAIECAHGAASQCRDGCHSLARLATIFDVGSEFLRSQPTDDGPVRLNLDRFGMPRDYASYMWLVYKRVVVDESPARRAFLNGGIGVPDFGQQVAWR